MTIVQPSGLTVFQKPKTFDLDGPSGFSQSEVVRRMLEEKELSSWSKYHGARIPRDRVGANPTETAGLSGPPMTPAERRIAWDTAPKTDQGIRICWYYNSHLRCSDSACARAKGFYKDYDALNPVVKIALIKRYGFKKKNKIAAGKIGGAITEIRKKAAQEADANRAAQAVLGGPNPQSMPTLRAAGNPTQNPSDLEGLGYLDSDEQLRRNLHGTQPLFADVPPQEEDARAGVVPIKGVGNFSDPKFLETVGSNERLDPEPKLLFLKNAFLTCPLTLGLVRCAPLGRGGG